jgi:hypothetical protein
LAEAASALLARGEICGVTLALGPSAVHHAVGHAADLQVEPQPEEVDARKSEVCHPLARARVPGDDVPGVRVLKRGLEANIEADELTRLDARRIVGGGAPRSAPRIVVYVEELGGIGLWLALEAVA